MQKLRTYWYVLKNSLTDPEYYYSLAGTKMRFSVQFFLLSIFLISLLMLPDWALRIIPTTVETLKTESTQLIEQLPQDAVFSYADGKMETHGLTLPTTIVSSQKMLEAGYSKNFLTISPEEKQADAMMTLTPTQAFFTMDDAPATTFSYKDMLGDAQGSVARDQIRTLAQTLLTDLYDLRWYIAAAIAVASLVGSIVSGLLTIALYSLLVQTIGWALNVRITYKQAFRWGLHIFPIALGIQLLSSLFVSAGSFPLFTVAYIAIATLVLWVGRSTRPRFEVQ